MDPDPDPAIFVIDVQDPGGQKTRGSGSGTLAARKGKAHGTGYSYRRGMPFIGSEVKKICLDHGGVLAEV
jgi:hypothetical protein